jgi:glycosyltransferase involved in cell wall biosynthesis
MTTIPRILFVTNTYAPHVVGGAEQLVQYLAEGFVAKGMECGVLTLGHSSEFAEDSINGVKVFRIPTTNVYHPCTPQAQRSGLKKVQFHLIDSLGLRRNQMISRVAQSFRPSVVHTHNLSGFSTTAIDVFSAHGFPVVHTLHDYYMICANTMRWHDGIAGAPQCHFCRFTAWKKTSPLKKIGHVIGVSKYILRVHQSKGLFDSVPSSVIHNGRPLLGAAEEKRQTHPELTFGFIGRVEKSKGIETLLSAMSLMRELPIKLLIAGKAEPEYLAALKRRFLDSRVHYLGYSSPQALFSQTDVAVYPSLWEEALSGAYEPYEFGVPVIGSQIGGIPEIIDEDSTGFLFEPGNSSQLALKMRQFYENPLLLKQMSAPCVKRRQHFTIERVLSHYDSVYRSVLARSPRRERVETLQ